MTSRSAIWSLVKHFGIFKNLFLAIRRENTEASWPIHAGLLLVSQTIQAGLKSLVGLRADQLGAIDAGTGIRAHDK